MAILRFLAFTVAGLLSSCIDSREEYWLEAGGNGLAELTYSIPAAAAALHGGESGIREMIAVFLKKTPEISASSYQVVTEGNRLRVVVNATFDSALAMKEIVSGAALKTLPPAVSHLAGEITTDLSGRTIDFSRRISPSKALPGAAFLPKSQLEGHRMIYIMHLPSAPVESNATRVEDAGRTLVWDYPLTQAVKAPLITRFKMPVPIPWRLLAAIGIPSTLAAFGFIAIRRRKSMRPFSSGNPDNLGL